MTFNDIAFITFNYLIFGMLAVAQVNYLDELKLVHFFSDTRSLRVLQRIGVILMWPIITIVIGLYYLLKISITELFK
jgi:hypothetical protein